MIFVLKQPLKLFGGKSAKNIVYGMIIIKIQIVRMFRAGIGFDIQDTFTRRAIMKRHAKMCMPNS